MAILVWFGGDISWVYSWRMKMMEKEKWFCLSKDVEKSEMVLGLQFDEEMILKKMKKMMLKKIII